MLKKLICSDVGQNRLMSAATIFFMTISAALLILTALLLTNLLEAIDDLMDRSSGLIFCWVWTGICRRFCRGGSICSRLLPDEIRSENRGRNDHWEAAAGAVRHAGSGGQSKAAGRRGKSVAGRDGLVNNIWSLIYLCESRHTVSQALVHGNISTGVASSNR